MSCHKGGTERHKGFRVRTPRRSQTHTYARSLKLHVDSKAGHANFVTDYDKKVQDRLKSGLLKIMPDAHFMGEEGTTQGFSGYVTLETSGSRLSSKPGE